MIDVASKAWKRRIRSLALLTLALGLAFWAIRGCAYMPWNREVSRGRVRITASRDFGKEVLWEVEEEAAGLTAMEALRRVARVETAYGGGFIVSIDGLASAYRGENSGKADWFFYVNGQMAEVGAADFRLREGDWVVFDYHSWERSMFTPVLAGCFPDPFVNGYREAPARCLVAHGEGLKGDAEELASALRNAGAARVETVYLGDQGDPWKAMAQGDYLIIVAGTDELESLEGWKRALAEAEARGIFALPEGDGLVMLDDAGRPAGKLEGEWGLVTGLAPRLDEPGSALVVTGRGKGLREALRGLLDRIEGRDGRPLLAMAYDGEGSEIPLPLGDLSEGKGTGSSPVSFGGR